jgi:hypothetical protein
VEAGFRVGFLKQFAGHQGMLACHVCRLKSADAAGNQLPVEESTLHGRKLPVGRYQAQLAATGGAEHTVSFAIKR